MKFLDRFNLNKSGMFDAFGTASTLGLHMVSGVLVGGAFGYLLDEWLGTSPWLKIVFFILGVAAGFLNVYRDTQRLLRQMEAPQNHGTTGALQNGSDTPGASAVLPVETGTPSESTRYK